MIRGVSPSHPWCARSGLMTRDCCLFSGKIAKAPLQFVFN
jgi:hypothetical protein